MSFHGDQKIEYLEMQLNQCEEEIDKNEETLNKINGALIKAFQSRRSRLLENTDSEYMLDHYEEILRGACGGKSHGGKALDQCETIDWIHWMSYSDKEKEQILDEELENYFN